MKNGRNSESKYKLLNGLKIDRRSFLKLTAFIPGLFGGGRANGQLDVTKAHSFQENIRDSLKENWVATSCLNCSGRCAIRVRVVNGKAVRITGNPLSKISEGRVCPKAHIGLQVLYDPERIYSPLKRTNKDKGIGIDPKWISISWEEALDEIINRLISMRERGRTHQLLLFSGLNSISSEDLIRRFADAFGTPNLITENGLENETEKLGHWMADGHYEELVYDLDHTHYILAFGADLLESSRPLSRYLRKWGRLRREKSNRSKVVIVHPYYSITSAKSDEWIPISPGTDAALAMGIAHVIISEQLFDKEFISHWTTGFETYKKFVLSQSSPQWASKITGIPQETIYRIAREFSQTRPAIAIMGKEAIAWPEGSYASYAIFCLNALVGGIDRLGGILYQEVPTYKEMPRLVEDEVAKKGRNQPPIDFRRTPRFPAARVITNQIPESLLRDVPYPIQMAIGFNSNLLFSAPHKEQWDRALKKLPYYVHLSPFVSEMALYADLVLPTTTYLEEWGYDHSSSGSGSPELRIKQPAVRPRGQARSVTDILFEISKRVKGTVQHSFALLGGNSREFVKLRTSTLIPWKDLLSMGVWVGKGYQYKKYHSLFKTPSRRFEFYSGNLKNLFLEIGIERKEDFEFLPHYKEIRFLGERKQYPLILLPYQPLMMMGNGSQNYPWAQETFLPMQGMGWDTLVEINSETAKALNLKEGQSVWVESPFKKIRTRIKFSEGVHPEVVAIPMGQGHDAYGKWQKGIGVNPNEILGVDYDWISGQSAFYNTRVKVYPV